MEKSKASGFTHGSGVGLAVELALDRLGVAWDEGQRRLIETPRKQVMLNCTRQYGKSTVGSARALRQACEVAESLTLVVSPSERQSRMFMRKVRDFVRRMGLRVRGDGDNPISVMLPNGSRIVGVPGNEETVRGFSAVSLVMIDEAARVPDAMYEAVLPMLAVRDGDLWLLSTPRGQRGFFYEEWIKGGDDWERVTVKATECPRISAAFLEKQRKRRGDTWFRKEYLCECVENGSVGAGLVAADERGWTRIYDKRIHYWGGFAGPLGDCGGGAVCGEDGVGRGVSVRPV